MCCQQLPQHRLPRIETAPNTRIVNATARLQGSRDFVGVLAQMGDQPFHRLRDCPVQPQQVQVTVGVQVGATDIHAGGLGLAEVAE